MPGLFSEANETEIIVSHYPQSKAHIHKELHCASKSELNQSGHSVTEMVAVCRYIPPLAVFRSDCCTQTFVSKASAHLADTILGISCDSCYSVVLKARLKKIKVLLDDAQAPSC